MKKILSLIAMVTLIVAFTKAEPVDIPTAKQVAENYYKHYAPESITDFSIKSFHTKSHNGINTYYTFVFNAGGFVIVSADNAIVPVLGYSHEGEIDGNKLNPIADLWMEQYDKNIVDIVSQKLSNTETLIEWNSILGNSFPKNDRAVNPIFNINWGQGTGFNTYCPAGCPVGCVATSMAMIMRHYEYPTTGAGWHKYVHPTYGPQTAYFFSTTYDYANMPTTSAGSPAAATLSYHLGVAVNMNYTPSGSGAYSQDVPAVMANYFKYDQSIMYVQKTQYTNDTWIALLKNELDNARPILYSGSDANYGGHAFLCLGYNDNNQFYFNWGWEGSSNGYFTIGALNPSGYAFNSNNSAVINIKPAAPGEEKFLWTEKFTSFPNNSTYPGHLSAVNESVAWATGRDGSGGGANYRVYCLTTDGGATWTSGQVNYGTAFSMIQGLDANTAFIAAYGTGSGNTILKTTDRGVTWTPILTGSDANSFFNTVHFFDYDNGVVQGDQTGGYHEIFVTSDGGENWTRVAAANIPSPVNTSEYGIVGHYTAVGNTLWWTTNNGYVYKTTDKGHNWTKHFVFDNAGATVNASIAFSDDALTGLLLAYVQGSPYRKFKTTDGGETWQELTSAPSNFYESDISAVPGETGMFVSVGADYQTPKMGISFTRDGGDTWEDYSQYYTASQFVSVGMISETKGFAGSFQGEYTGGMWVLGETATFNADFEVDITKACVEQEVTFTNLSFGHTTISWDFGEGATPATADTDGPHTVTYSTPGNKTISISASDGNTTLTETKNNLVEIVGLPTPDFTYEVNQSFPKLVNFNASSSAGVVTGAKYVWDMGNGKIVEKLVPEMQYIYTGQDVYNVTLTIENIPGGCSNSITKPVDNTLSIEETGLNELLIYPNPANEKLVIANVNGAKIEIYSIEGRLIHNSVADSDSYEVNTSAYKAGVYSVKVIGIDNVITKTIVIQ